MCLKGQRNVFFWLQTEVQPPEIEVCSTSDSGHSNADDKPHAGLGYLGAREPAIAHRRASSGLPGQFPHGCAVMATPRARTGQGVSSKLLAVAVC